MAMECKDSKKIIAESFQIVSVVTVFIIASTLISPHPVSAKNGDIQFYRIDVDIDENNMANVDMVITFKYPERRFSFDVIGRVENFQATSNAGPVDCDVDVSGTSTINCNMNLTAARKEMEINFETTDFVKILDNKHYLSADMSPDADVDGVSATFKLPKGFLLVGEDIDSSILSYSENASAHIVGGRILIVWDLSNTQSDEQLKFDILYEQVKKPAWFELRMRHFLLFGAAFAVVVGFVFIRHLRKSETLVLSVLDDYERQIMNIITKEGDIKQRKIVRLTNLSKAKVSRVVKSLAERGLIEVERIGRTNRIRLSKKRFEL
jgi:hypothetical protein